MRSWFVIPAMGVACGGAAVALGVTPVAALTGAAIAAVIRVLAGDAPAALAGAVVAPLLAVASLADAGGALPRAALALAAAGWAISELARDDGAPLVALLPAAIAGALDPSFIALPAIAGVRWVLAPGPRPRWALAVPLAGALAIGLAIAAGTAWPGLGARWFGGAAHAIAPARLAALAGAGLGPLTAVAALAGIASLLRPRLATLALGAAVVGALLVDLRAGALGPATIGLAALLSGLAIDRLAAMIRLPAGQAITGATIGALLIFPPTWTAVAGRARPTGWQRGSPPVEQRGPASHIARASR